MKFHKLNEPKKSSGGSSSYVKIGDGESLTVVPRGEIFGFRIKWENNKAVEIPETNPAKHNRFKVNVIINENGSYIAKVWEFGILIYNQLAAYSESFAKENLPPITKTKIKISRKGVSTATEWFLIPLGPVKSTELVNIESVKLNILGSVYPEIRTIHNAPAESTDRFANPDPDDAPYFGDDPGVTEEDLPF